MRPQYTYCPRNAMLDSYFPHHGEIVSQALPYSAGDSSVIHRYDENSVRVKKSSHRVKRLQARIEVVKRLVEHNHRKTFVADKSSNVRTDEFAGVGEALSGPANCSVGVVDSKNPKTKIATCFFQQAISTARVQNPSISRVLPHEMGNHRVPALL
jgi:hypothetical protein